VSILTVIYLLALLCEALDFLINYLQANYNVHSLSIPTWILRFHKDYN